MRKLFVIAMTLSLFLLQSTVAQTKPAAKTSSGSGAPINSVDEGRLRQHVRFLSHDLLEGRGTGQRGGDIAAEYIATQFALYGLKPAGDNGSYMQKVPLVGVTTSPDSTFTLIPPNGGPMTLTFKDEYVVYNESFAATENIDAEIVWAGYGIDAPEYKWNDFKDVDVKGKILLMLVSDPPSEDPNFFKGRALTYYGRWTYKYEQAARKGAAGVILIHRTDMASYPWDVVRNSNSGEKAYLRNNKPKLKAAGWIQLEIARKLAAQSGMDLEAMFKEAQSRDFRPRATGARLKAMILTKTRAIESNNVLAILPGSDPKLKDQAVVYTAHYDHLGIRADVAGDNIYNGANDNATGCAMLLEIAHAFAEAKQKPRRSILFASVTAEEQGLRGSEYLGQNPPIPAGKISLNLNFDDIDPLGEPEEVVALGSERSDFYPVVQATAKDFGLAIKPDPRPERGSYYRSDHFSMARVGVPALSVKEGDKFAGHPREWGEQKAEEYNTKHYHQPSDQYHADMDFRSNAKISRFGIALGWKAANMEKMVGWVAGDEFEPARKTSQNGGASH